MIWNMSRALVCVGALFGAAPAFGTTIGFDAYAPTNAANPLRITAGGVTATFDSPNGAGAFIAEDGSAFSTLGSSVLADDNFAAEELDIGFSPSLVAASFGFATNDSGAPTAVTLTALLNGTAVGSVTATGALAASGLPEGVLSFNGSTFNTLQVTDSDPSNEGFAIGAVTVAVPEPAPWWLLTTGLLTLVAVRRRARTAQ